MAKGMSLVFVLALSSVASASMAGFYCEGLDYVKVDPGEVITVELIIAPEAVPAMTFEQIVDTASVHGQVVQGTEHINAGFDWSVFTGIGGINVGDFLFLNVTGKVELGSPDVTGTLFSFDYEVSDNVALDEIFIIGPGEGMGDADDIVPNVLTLEVIPEPVTIILLSFGGLIALRKQPKEVCK